jgi:prevent-host-death family protein
MQIAVTEAKAQLTELVRRAQAGDEVILTRHGQPAARIVPVQQVMNAATKRAVLDRIMGEARLNPIEGVSAERSADFLYDENGLPG